MLQDSLPQKKKDAEAEAQKGLEAAATRKAAAVAAAASGLLIGLVDRFH